MLRSAEVTEVEVGVETTVDDQGNRMTLEFVADHGLLVLEK